MVSRAEVYTYQSAEEETTCSIQPLPSIGGGRTRSSEAKAFVKLDKCFVEFRR